MTPRIRRLVLHGGSFLLAAGLLLLALYGVELGTMWDAFREADWRWLIPLAAIVLASNLCRAWRWQVLIEALPTTPNLDTLGEDEPSTSNTLEASFSSIMIGYMVNYVAPRLGEVARTANMAARSSFRFSSLLGTVVSERIFDTAVLGLALMSAVVLLHNRLSVLREEFLDPAWTRLSSIPAEWLAVGTGVLLLLGLLFFLLIRYEGSRQDSWLVHFWTHTVKSALVSFKEGMMTLLTSPRRGAILVSTVGMWGGYLLMAYVPFIMLDLATSYGIGLVDAWILMAIGALGLLVPTPGGIGSYHYITREALVHLYGVPAEPALTYAVLAHAAQLVFYILTGGLAIVYQGTGLEALYPPEDVEPSVVEATDR